jgi:hypothetical protein
MSRVLLALLAAMFLVTAATPAEAQRRSSIPAYEEVPLQDVFRDLRRRTNLPFVIDWRRLEAAGVLRETEISIDLPGVTPRVFLNNLLRLASPTEPLTFYLDEGVVRVTTLAAADAVLITRLYPIGDLIVTVPDFDVGDVRLGLGGGGGGGGQGFGGQGSGGDDRATTEAERAEDLVELIQATVRPELWRVNGGNSSIRYFRGFLVVNAPRSVHDRL